jgi:hypothetical protein
LETCENHEGFFDIDIENGALWGGKMGFKLALTFRVTYEVGILKNVTTGCNAHLQEWALRVLKCLPFIEKNLNATRYPPTKLQNF